MKGTEEKGNLTESWSQNNVSVRVFDGAYACKSPEKQKKILERLTQVCRQCYQYQYTNNNGNNIK